MGQSPSGKGEMEQFLIHNYANLITPVESNLKNLNNFIWSCGGGQDRFRQAGIDGNLFAMTLDKKKYYACFSKFEKENFLADLYIYHEDFGKNNDEDELCYKSQYNGGSKLPILRDDDIITPDNDIFKEICRNIDLHILQIRRVLDRCSNGEIPYLYVNKCFKKASELGSFCVAWKKWDAFIGLNGDIADGLDLDITDYIDLTGVLLPSITRDDTKLEYSKKCINCGTYYQAKGQKAVFCSEACRSSYRRKMKKQKARPPTS